MNRLLLAVVIFGFMISCRSQIKKNNYYGETTNMEVDTSSILTYSYFSDFSKVFNLIGSGYIDTVKGFAVNEKVIAVRQKNQWKLWQKPICYHDFYFISSEFKDITGDSKPELIINCGTAIFPMDKEGSTLEYTEIWQIDRPELILQAFIPQVTEFSN